MLDYYRRIAPVLVPHLRGRPLTLKRYPDGVDGGVFYEKNSPSHRPDWVEVAPIWSRHNRRTISYTLVNDTATLIWVANLASIELHPSLSLATAMPTPTSVVFDLDPGPGTDLVTCAGIALELREVFHHWHV